jgi:hypothetical protein
MHATLKGETSRPPAEQQARFTASATILTTIARTKRSARRRRPAVTAPSPRPYPSRIEKPWYDAEHAVLRVRPNGEIKWGGDLLFLSEALAGEPIGIAETAPGDWLVRFADVELAIIDRNTKSCVALWRAGRPAMEENRNKPRKLSGMYPVL